MKFQNIIFCQLLGPYGHSLFPPDEAGSGVPGDQLPRRLPRPVLPHRGVHQILRRRN